MSRHSDRIRQHLAGGPLTTRQLIDKTALSQPTLWRALSALSDEIVRLGAGPSIQYALCDASRGLPDIAVYRVSADAKIERLGHLVPVRPEGFVLRQENGGRARHSDGLPWWLFDMRPQGYLGRVYAARHGPALGLPGSITAWTDTHVLRALLAHGHDVTGNLLLGDAARESFLAMPAPEPLSEEQKPAAYAALALAVAHGEIPGSSAGGKQPKFTTYAITPSGPRHQIVKFSEREPGPVTERWRDLLLAEHLALTTLREADISAAKTQIPPQIHDADGQRFLEVERFDRVGALGRHMLISLAALDAEFVGAGAAAWPVTVHRLAADHVISPEAAATADLLWAFGSLIGNTDMHSGNLSFMSEQGRPYDLAPAYDMSPMAFAPRSGGGLPDTLPEINILADIAAATWRRAETLARTYLARLTNEPGFSQRFRPCIENLDKHIQTASARLSRLI
ncbi:MAG: type II toxin-antitoxin system HipA family toxin YjjJ [Azonexus sp.]|jgi:hypothetical protein|uniref:type II toxin-antitoxin system HipA family toxin YjjJ n=1 Tax=Azonexus sp. TaxID=1872668 RepID=UPI00282ADCEC|nr:type II toxin-antitoxin system HipA family toxin YjjJ [Azonexus sp.]MDR0776622.1 type II toxin-antitoxin system HipA family toxin YjjJ [Azonexus sp.]